MADFEGTTTERVPLLVEVYDAGAFEKDGTTYRTPVISLHPDSGLAFGQRDPYLSSFAGPDGRVDHRVPVEQGYVDAVVAAAGDNRAPILDASGARVGWAYSVEASLVDLKLRGEVVGKVPDVSSFEPSALSAGVVDGQSAQERMADNVGFARKIWKAYDERRTVDGVDVRSAARSIYDGIGDPEAVAVMQARLDAMFDPERVDALKDRLRGLSEGLVDAGVDLGIAAGARRVQDMMDGLVAEGVDPGLLQVAAMRLQIEQQQAYIAKYGQRSPTPSQAAGGVDLPGLINWARDHKFKAVGLAVVLGAVMRNPAMAEAVGSAVRNFMALKAVRPYLDRVGVQHQAQQQAEPVRAAPER